MICTKCAKAQHNITLSSHFSGFQYNYCAITATTATYCHPGIPLNKGEVAEWQYFQEKTFFLFLLFLLLFLVIFQIVRKFFTEVLEDAD